MLLKAFRLLFILALDVADNLQCEVIKTILEDQKKATDPIFSVPNNL